MVFGKKAPEFKKVNVSVEDKPVSALPQLAWQSKPAPSLPVQPKQSVEDEIRQLKEQIAIKEKEIMEEEKPVIPFNGQKWQVRYLAGQSTPILFNEKDNKQFDFINFLCEAMAYVLNNS